MEKIIISKTVNYFTLYKNNSFNKVMKFGNERCKLSFVEFFQSTVILNLQFQEKSEELILYGGETFLQKEFKRKLTELRLKLIMAQN